MLILPIKKKWYDMILSGEKKEEYREIKPYWENRFIHYNGKVLNGERKEIMFRNGYSKNSPSFTAVCTIDIGEGKAEWGAEPCKKYYRLHIHEICARQGNNEPETKEKEG